MKQENFNKKIAAAFAVFTAGSVFLGTSFANIKPAEASSDGIFLEQLDVLFRLGNDGYFCDDYRDIYQKPVYRHHRMPPHERRRAERLRERRREIERHRHDRRRIEAHRKHKILKKHHVDKKFARRKAALPRNRRILKRR